MSWGLQTYDESGNVKLTQDKQLCRLIWSHIAGGGNSGFHRLDIANYNNVTVIGIPLNGDSNIRHFGHTVTIDSSGLVRWTAQNLPSFSTNFTTQRAYPMHSSTMIQVFGYG